MYIKVERVISNAYNKNYSYMYKVKLELEMWVIGISWMWDYFDVCTQPAITCSKLTIKTLKQGVKYVQS